MRRHPPLTVAEISASLRVDLESGRCFWLDGPKERPDLRGCEAGGAHRMKAGTYWTIKLNGRTYKRAQIVVTIKSGEWPAHDVDHRNGQSLDDRATNLRHATRTQNNQNHRRGPKKSGLPTGVKLLPSGRYSARVTDNKQQIQLGTFDTSQEASDAYIAAQQALFGEFAPV